MPQTEAELKADEQYLTAEISAQQIGFRPARVWNPSPSKAHRLEPYDLPMTIRIGMRVFPETGAKFSPPPYAVAVEDDSSSALVVVGAEAGWHLWNEIDFTVSSDGVNVSIDLERHSDPREVLPHVSVLVVPGKAGESRFELLARGLARLYPAAYVEPKEPVPAWWLRPIYCGWGDQVAASMHEHGVALTEGVGGRYCRQDLYEKWIARLEKAEVPLGTIIIDAGWSKRSGDRWPDLRGFIDRQHDLGRRVLLWIGAWGGRRSMPQCSIRRGENYVAADPTHPDYQAWMTERVQEMISPDGYDCDGFKIDQLASCPTERGRRDLSSWEPLEGNAPYMRVHDGRTWGVELMHQWQKLVHDAAKPIKADALINSSTVHPYFHDVIDMVRLHDTGPVDPKVIVESMHTRAKLSRAALPYKVIDTDDWVSRNYQMWLDYTMQNYKFGVPCIFYAERFVDNWEKEPATRPIEFEDLQRIGRVWAEHVEDAVGR